MSDEFHPLERQADALEAIATELRYQNAVLCELLASMDGNRRSSSFTDRRRERR